MHAWGSSRQKTGQAVAILYSSEHWQKANYLSCIWCIVPDMHHQLHGTSNPIFTAMAFPASFAQSETMRHNQSGYTPRAESPFAIELATRLHIVIRLSS